MQYAINSGIIILVGSCIEGMGEDVLKIGCLMQDNSGLIQRIEEFSIRWS